MNEIEIDKILPSYKDSVTEQIMVLCDINVCQRRDLIDKTARLYLFHHLPDLEEYPEYKRITTGMLLGSLVFWDWFVARWECREKGFLCSLNNMVLGNPLSFYLINNDAQVLSQTEKMPGHILSRAKTEKERRNGK